jgi:Electron transfer DM13
MPSTTSILIGAALVAGGGLLWYLFRPDALVFNKTVNEPFPGAEPSSMAATLDELYSGTFHSNAHETRGVATIYHLDDGRRVLRLTKFSTSNGPDVRVYIVAATDVQEEDAAKRAGIVDLGVLKGNIGDQNYDVPTELDLSKYRAVSIWCRRFSVNFGAAPLAPSKVPEAALVELPTVVGRDGADQRRMLTASGQRHRRKRGASART